MRTGGPRRPPLLIAAFAIPAGALIGARIALALVLLMYGPDTILAPASSGGTGSVGVLLFAVTGAAVVGGALGLLAGAVLAGLTALLWMLGAPSALVAAAGGLVAAASAFALVVSWATWDPQSVVLAALGATSGVGGAILLAWAGDVGAGRLPGWR